MLFDSWTSDRETLNKGEGIQVDTEPAAKINSPKYLIIALQTQAKPGPANKGNNEAFLETIDVSKYFVKIDGQRYNSIIIETLNFFNEYVGETILNPFIS